MGYAFFFLFSAVVLGAISLTQQYLSPAVFIWPVVSLIALAIAYATNDAHAFGKRPDGTLHPLRALLFAPWLAFATIAEGIARRLDRAPAFATVDDISFGRRTLATPTNDALVIDLTAEFAETRPLRSARYFAFPILDARAPPLANLQDLVDTTRGPVFIHCAQGRGRTGLVAACFLLARGLASSPDDAIRLLTSQRPGIALNREQRIALNSFAQSCEQR